MSEENIWLSCFVDYHGLPDIIWHCLINDNISIPEKVIYIYI